jgi:hypothetical protein
MFDFQRTQLERALELARRLRREPCRLEELRQLFAGADELAAEVAASSDGTLDEHDHAILAKAARDLRELVRALERMKSARSPPLSRACSTTRSVRRILPAR